MSNFTIRRAGPAVGCALATLAVVSVPALSPAAVVQPPSVSTGTVTRALSTSATLTGTINPHGSETTYYFQYGPGSSSGGAPAAYASQTTPGTLAAGTASEKVSQAVTGLLPGYHYRLLATNGSGQLKTGKDRVYVVKVKKTKSAFVLPSSFEPTPVGGSFFLGGTLTGTGNASRAVVLQGTPYPYTAAYANVGSPALTSATGGFSFRVPRLTTSTRFRVATVNAPLLFSPTVTQLAVIRVSLKVRTSKRVKGLIRLYGTASPAEVGARVFLQLEQLPKQRPTKSEKPEKTPKEEREHPPRFQTKFTTVLKRASQTSSRFSIVVMLRDSGNYRAFVDLPAGPLASGGSETVALHAPPKKKSH